MAYLQDRLRQVATGSAIKIVCFGDSITAGYSSFLQDILRSYFDNQNVTVINKGTGGNTAADMVNRFQTAVIDEAPKLVIVNAGQNDCRPANNISCASFRNSLNSLFDKLNNYSYVVFGMTPRYKAFENDGEDVAEYYRKTLKRVTAENAKDYIDMLDPFNELYKSGGAVRELISPDGVHYNDIGNHFLASVLFRDFFTNDDVSIKKGQFKDYAGQWVRKLSGTALWNNGVVVDGVVRLSFFVDEANPSLTIEMDGTHDVNINGVDYTGTGNIIRTDLVPGMNFFDIIGECTITGFSLS